MLMVLQHGDMPEWKAVKNMHMFAKEVIPRVRRAVEQRRGGHRPGGGEVAMASYREERFTCAASRPSCRSPGEGDPLVFLHGAGTVTGFDALLPLAERFKLIVPLPSRLRPSATTPPSTTSTTTAATTSTCFDELGLEEMALAGHSMGGWLAANFAADHTERVTRLVLARPSGCATRSIRRPTSWPSPATAAALPDGDMSIFEGHVPMPPTPEFLPTAIARARRPRGSCGRAHTTSSCTAGCTACDADADPVGRRPIG
jgi:pimeloyl-ACP methyl ester carboxylesterase